MASLPSRLQRLRVFVLGGLVPTMLGLLIVGMGIYSYLHRQHFLARATHTQGTVVGNSRDRVSGIRRGSALHYKPIFRFADAAGKRWQVTDQSSDYTLAPTPVGQSCPVLYNPDDPAEAQLELPDTWWNRMGSGPLFTVFGVCMAAVGVWCLRRYPLGSDPSQALARDPTILSNP